MGGYPNSTTGKKQEKRHCILRVGKRGMGLALVVAYGGKLSKDVLQQTRSDTKSHTQIEFATVRQLQCHQRLNHAYLLFDRRAILQYKWQTVR